jgi:hypothetical protein
MKLSGINVLDGKDDSLTTTNDEIIVIKRRKLAAEALFALVTRRARKKYPFCLSGTPGKHYECAQ